MRVLRQVFFFSFILSCVLYGFSNTVSDRIEEEGYFFEMDEKSRQEFLTKLSRVELNDTPRKAVSILGLPQYDDEAFDKKGKFIARIMVYYIKLRKHGLVSEGKDESASLYFDENGKLKEINSNIPGVPNRKRE